MISIKKNLLFIHIPKTGGNSIQNILMKYSEDKITSQNKFQDGIERFGINYRNYNLKKHSPLRAYKEELDESLYNSLYKVSVLRNPWDRMISLYFSPHAGRTTFNEKTFVQMIKKQPTMEEFLSITSKSSILDLLTFRNNKRKTQAIDDNIDFLMRYENIDQDFKELCGRINIAQEELPVRNKSKRGHYSEYYNEELMKLVANKFAMEVEFGKYTFSN